MANEGRDLVFGDVEVDVLQTFEGAVEKIEVADLYGCFFSDDGTVGHAVNSSGQDGALSRKKTRAKMLRNKTVRVMSKAPPQAKRTQLS